MKKIGKNHTLFSIRALADEESEWKDYRKHLDDRERKDFDEMFKIPRLYVSACSGSVRLGEDISYFHGHNLPSLQGTDGNCRTNRSKRADKIAVTESKRRYSHTDYQVIRRLCRFAAWAGAGKEFDEMLKLCYRYAEAINAKGEPFPEEAVIITLLFKQHLIIKELKQAMEKLRNEGEKKQLTLTVSGWLLDAYPIKDRMNFLD